MSRVHFLLLLFLSAVISAGACDDSDANDVSGMTEDDTSSASLDEGQTDSDSHSLSQDTDPGTELSTDEPEDTSGSTDPQDFPTDTSTEVDTQPPTDSAADSNIEAEQVTILDVRTPAEYAEGHLDCAVNIPLADLEDRLGELPNKDAIIIVYCRSGNRSAQAKKILEDNGYTAVIDGKGLTDLRQDIANGAYNDLELPCVS